MIRLPVGVTVGVGSELSKDVDPPAELDADSLGIGATIYFAFYCLFLTAFYFQCKLCSSPWKWFLASLGRAEIHCGELMSGSSWGYLHSHVDFFMGTPTKRLWKMLEGYDSKIDIFFTWALSRTQELRCFKASEHFFWNKTFVGPLNIFRMCPELWFLCFDTLMVSAFPFLNERFVTWLAWNWKRSEHCVPAPLITHNVSATWDSTSPLNTTRKNLLRQAGSNVGRRLFCHCFPPKFDNICSRSIKTQSPREGAGEDETRELTACSKELGKCSSWRCAHLPQAAARQSVEKPSRHSQTRSIKSNIFP